MKNHSFHPSILREYDIRGRMGETLHEHDAYALGLAFGTHLQCTYQKQKVAIGYDGRHSSPGLAHNVIKGLNETGTHTVMIGLCPSPMLYFAVQTLDVDAGMMITGSHNPPAYNGFKMSLKNASVYGAEIQRIGAMAQNGDFESGQGQSQSVDIQDQYITRLIKDLDMARPLKIAWDNGNGAAGNVLQALIQNIPGEHISLYETIDGRFPNHHPDPTVDQNLTDLIATVKANHCDLGIAFDGDGDRIGVVDENGTIIRCDTLMAVYAADVLESHPGATIIGDVKCSDAFFDEVKRLGGKPVMAKTGHSLVKTKMKETNAPLAGELSGHIFFADRYYGYDDALYCALRLINIASRTHEGLSSRIAHLPHTYCTPEIRIDVAEDDKFPMIDAIKQIIKQHENITVNDLDGVRVSTDEGWWIIRASNTQNALSVRLESQSKQGLTQMKQDVLAILQTVLPELESDIFT